MDETTSRQPRRPSPRREGSERGERSERSERRRYADRERRGSQQDDDSAERRPPSPSGDHRLRSRHARHAHHARHSHRHSHDRPRSAERGDSGGGSSSLLLPLPHGARHLSRAADYRVFEPLFAHYLDRQKRLRLADLDERAVRGRWRHFVGKWNRRALPDAWYEPQMFLRAVRAAREGAGDASSAPQEPQAQADDQGMPLPPALAGGAEDGSGGSGEDRDEYGPALPPPPSQSTDAAAAASSARRNPGPAIPSLADLAERRAVDDDARDAGRAALRLARRADRAEQRERLDDLAPRAAAGTRERQLEKRRALNDKLRGFRDRSPGGGAAEVDDAELMGGGDDKGPGDDYRRMLASQQRRQTDRQARRDEERRARDEELSERRRQHRAREDEKVAVLRELARQRFG